MDGNTIKRLNVYPYARVCVCACVLAYVCLSVCLSAFLCMHRCTESPSTVKCTIITAVLSSDETSRTMANFLDKTFVRISALRHRGSAVRVYRRCMRAHLGSPLTLRLKGRYGLITSQLRSPAVPHTAVRNCGTQCIHTAAQAPQHFRCGQYCVCGQTAATMKHYSPGRADLEVMKTESKQ